MEKRWARWRTLQNALGPMVFRAPFLTVLGACAVFSLAFGKNTTRSLSSLPGYSIPVNPSGFLGPQGNSLGEVFEYESLGIGWLNEPVVDASGNIYITFSSVYVVALSPTGTTLWSLSDSSGASLEAGS